METDSTRHSEGAATRHFVPPPESLLIAKIPPVRTEVHSIRESALALVAQPISGRNLDES